MEPFNVEERFTQSGHMTESYKEDVLDYGRRFVKDFINRTEKLKVEDEASNDNGANQLAMIGMTKQKNKNKCKML